MDTKLAIFAIPMMTMVMILKSFREIYFFDKRCDTLNDMVF